MLIHLIQGTCVYLTIQRLFSLDILADIGEDAWIAKPLNKEMWNDIESIAFEITQTS